MDSSDIKIVRCDEADYWVQIWGFMQDVFRGGDSYPVAPNVTEKEAKAYWFAEDKITHVAIDAAGTVLGTYYIRPNQPSLGAHICNCGYIVSAASRGRGIASLMCLHSQEFGAKQGYRGMQYNLVVSTNEGAVRLWKKHGFEIIGTLPSAFNHKDLGYVDAHIMFKQLGSEA